MKSIKEELLGLIIYEKKNYRILPKNNMEELNKDDKNISTKNNKNKLEKNENTQKDLLPIIYNNIIAKIINILWERHEILNKYNYNISEYFRELKKEKHANYIENCFPNPKSDYYLKLTPNYNDSLDYNYNNNDKDNSFIWKFKENVLTSLSEKNYSK